jgi:biopolymer transport protein ExbD
MELCKIKQRERKNGQVVLSFNSKGDIYVSEKTDYSDLKERISTEDEKKKTHKTYVIRRQDQKPEPVQIEPESAPIQQQ